MFKWETLTEIGPYEAWYRGKPVPGMTVEIELTCGNTVQAWRSNDGQQYFCHGLTFGGKDAPGGIISPFTGQPVEVILQQHYEMIAEADARAGDVVVWRGIAPETTPHSAILTKPIIAPDKKYLDYGARLQTKNGLTPETNMTLAELIAIYGESYRAFRKR